MNTNQCLPIGIQVDSHTDWHIIEEMVIFLMEILHYNRQESDLQVNQKFIVNKKVFNIFSSIKLI